MEIINFKTKIEKPLNFESQRDVIVPAGTNLIINDLGVDETWKSEFSDLVTRNVVFMEPGQISELLLKGILQNPLPFYKKSIAVLYPMKGGVAVKKNLDIKKAFPQSFVEEFKIPTKRLLPNSNPKVRLPKKLITNLLSRNFDLSMVIDDAIVTGQTIASIKDAIYDKTDKFDYSDYEQGLRFSWSSLKVTRIPIDWYAASWFAASRQKEQETTLSGFKSVRVGIYYQGQSGQPPLNSISTWVEDDTKGDFVLKNYAAKYAKKPDDFIKFVSQLKGGD